MRVNGELIQACLEQIAAATSTPATRGRVYADITNPTAAVPKFYDGSQWQTLAFEKVEPGIVTQNSGTSVTVDWSQSLTQIIQLTNHCVINFTNPQQDKVHTLIVTQHASSIFRHMFNVTDIDPQQSAYQPAFPSAEGNNEVYKFIYKTGIKPAFSYGGAGLSSDRVWSSTTAARGVAMHPNKKYLLTGVASTPFRLAHYLAKNGANKNARIGLSPQNAVVATAAVGIVACPVFSPLGDLYFEANATTPFIQAWRCSPEGSLNGASLTNPSTIPTASRQCIDVHPTGNFVVVGGGTSPFMEVYRLNLPVVSGAAWGVKLANPGSLPVAQVNAVKFSPHGDYLAVGGQTTPFLEVYAFDQVTGAIGAKAASPSPLPKGGPDDTSRHGIAWRPQGDYIAMAGTVTPYVYVIPFNRATRSFGTPITFTDTLNGSTAGNKCVAWSPCGTFLYTSGSGGSGPTPFFAVYDFSTFTLGGALETCGAGVATSSRGLLIDPCGDVAYVALDSTDAIATIALPTRVKNYLRVSAGGDDGAIY